jgi:hypothetical protein
LLQSFPRSFQLLRVQVRHSVYVIAVKIVIHLLDEGGVEEVRSGFITANDHPRNVPKFTIREE